jgi:hypothetical protein
VNIQQMMKQAQQMQERLQKQMADRTNTTACFRIRRFGDRPRTRCTLAPETRCPQT